MLFGHLKSSFCVFFSVHKFQIILLYLILDLLMFCIVFICRLVCMFMYLCLVLCMYSAKFDIMYSVGDGFHIVAVSCGE
jgi:hypothetical protein